MQQSQTPSWLESSNFKNSSSILDIQFLETAQENERIIERLIMTAKTVAVGLKGNQYPKVTEMKKLNACVLKIEEGIKILSNQESSKVSEYSKELMVIKTTLTKVEKRYAKEHSTSWWDWVLVFAISYWWFPIAVGIIIFIMIKLF